MKIIKIILVAIVLGVIGYFIWQWTTDVKIDEKGGVPAVKATNQFTEKIERGIEELKVLTIEDFNKNKFKNIQSELDDFYNAGDLGEDSSQNKANYNSLSKTLFAVYVPKFIDQTYIVFKGDVWKQSDLTYIQKEIEEIQNTPFFDVSSSSYNSNFQEMNATISTYNTLVSFNVQMKKFPSISDYSVYGRFPKDVVEQKIAQSKIHLNTCVNTEYVNYLTWLKNELKKIPKEMYEKHFNYLKKQIQQNSGKYKSSEFDSQADYSRSIYQPLKRSIAEFDNSIYGVDYNSEYRVDYKKLMDMLDIDNDNASRYFKAKWDKQMKTP